MVLDIERAAMKEEPMPSGLSFTDQVVYIGLRYLYGSVRRGIIPRGMASEEKKKLLAEVSERESLLSFEKSCFEGSAKRFRETELAASAYRKNRTLENADALLIAVDGGDFSK